MKTILIRIFTFSICIYVMQFVYSQPTLNDANTNPQIGEYVILNTWDASSTSQGSAGAGITWDFSGITSTGTSSYTWVASSSSPYSSNFTNANMAYEAGGVWDFYKVTSAEYSRCGAVTSLGAIIPFSDPEKFLTFPFTYGSSFVDNFSGNYSYSGYNFYRHGTINVTGDAYGTLILPSFTYTDVLRVKIVEDYQDDYMGSPYMYYDSEVYLWYKPGIHHVVLSITDFTGGASHVRYGLFYNGASGMYGNDIADLSFNIYPNPAADHIHININKLVNKEITIQLFDLNGRKLYQEISNGDFQLPIDVSAFPEGIYMLRITSGNQVATGKLIIKRA